MPRTFAVYIMASRRNGTLYIGVTNNLSLRAHQHRTGAGSVFTTKYGVTRLVWYEFPPGRQRSDRPREAVEEMGAPLEAGTDREFQSGLGGFVRDPQSVRRVAADRAFVPARTVIPAQPARSSPRKRESSLSAAALSIDAGFPLARE